MYKGGRTPQELERMIYINSAGIKKQDKQAFRTYRLQSSKRNNVVHTYTHQEEIKLVETGAFGFAIPCQGDSRRIIRFQHLSEWSVGSDWGVDIIFTSRTVERVLSRSATSAPPVALPISLLY